MGYKEDKLITAVVSQSPEEMSEHFFKTLSRWVIPHRVSAWSRKDNFSLSKDFYFLSQRDYIHLKRSQNLPPPGQICLLMTEDYEPIDESEMMVWKSSFIIVGNEKGRGELSAYLYAYLVKHSFKNDFEDLVNSPHKQSIFSIPWLKLKVEGIVEEISLLGGTHTLEISLDGKKILINAEVPIACPDWSDFSETLTPLDIPEGIISAPGNLILKKISRDSTITIASSLDSVRTKLHVILEVFQTQKAFEKRHRLYGVVPNAI
jgi:hypothetical protein